MTATAFLRVSIRRIIRDRTALFFMIVLPVLIILIIGMTIRGTGRLRVGVVDEGAGTLSRELRVALENAPSLDVHHVSTESAGATAVRRGELVAAVVLPRDLDAQLRGTTTVEIPVIADQTNTSQQAATAAIESVLAEHGARVMAARYVVAQTGANFDVALSRAARTQQAIPVADVHTEAVNATSSILPEGFDYSAPTMLVLFVFINAVAGGAAMIESRRLGIYARASAAPVTARTIIGGETLTYLILAICQSILIVGVGAIFFGVHWGNAPAASVLVLTWALVGTSAGMLSGTLFRTAEQASAIGPAAGIALGMLGGCMWPLEIVPKAMRTIGHAIPHAWAVDAWVTLLSKGGTITDIGRQVGILIAYAVVLLSIAVVRLRRVLVA